MLRDPELQTTAFTSAYHDNLINTEEVLTNEILVVISTEGHALVESTINTSGLPGVSYTMHPLKGHTLISLASESKY